MSVTLLVLNLPTSRLVNPSQPENIELISVTFLVLKLLKFKLVNLLQPENIELIFLTLLVSKFSNPSIFTSVLSETLYPIKAST